MPLVLSFATHPSPHCTDSVPVTLSVRLVLRVPEHELRHPCVRMLAHLQEGSVVAAAAEVPHGALQSPGRLAAHLGRGDSGCSQNVCVRQETLQYAADVEVYCCWRNIFWL